MFLSIVLTNQFWALLIFIPFVSLIVYSIVTGYKYEKYGNYSDEQAEKFLKRVNKLSCNKKEFDSRLEKCLEKYSIAQTQDVDIKNIELFNILICKDYCPSKMRIRDFFRMFLITDEKKNLIYKVKGSVFIRRKI